MALELSKTIKARILSFDRDTIRITLTTTISKCDDFASQAGHSVVFMCDGVEDPVVVPLENGIAQAKVSVPKNQFQYLGTVINFTAKLTSNGDEVSGSIEIPPQMQELNALTKLIIYEFLNATLLFLAWVFIPNFMSRFGWYVCVNLIAFTSFIIWNKMTDKMDMRSACMYTSVHATISATVIGLWIFFRHLASL